MSLFNPIPIPQLRRLYQYRGWVLFAPVYVGQISSPAPNLTTRNGIPEWVLDWAEALARVLPLPGYPIAITGRLDGKPLSEDADLQA
jgi:hypothetical protein